jgi:hypothetical protein
MTLGVLAVGSVTAAEWRRAGAAGAESAQQSTSSEVRSVVVRRDQAAPEFDPFEEPLTEADAAMPQLEPEAEPAAEASAPIALDPSPGAPPAPAGEEYDPFEADEAEADSGGDDASRADDLEQAFDEPVFRGSPRVAIAPIQEDDSPSSPVEAPTDEELPPPRPSGIPARDAPGGVRPMPVEVPDAAVEADDLEEAFPEPDQGLQPSDELDPRGQQAPGQGLNFRGLEEPLTPEQQEERRRVLEGERLQAEEDCEDMVAAVRADDITTISLDIRTEGEPGEDYPFECGLGRERFEPRRWPQVTYLWKASGLCHKPLYFEQVQVERYGHSWPPVVQPLLSGAHFFASVPLLPYKMGLTTPNECIYTLGHYRPGSCAPYMIEAVPFTWRAAAFEAGAWTGGAFAIP